MLEWLQNIPWTAVLEIIAIDLLLGGDNAVVIALACRNLPPAQRRLGILWGTVGAIVLRIALIFMALSLLQVPGLKLVGGVLLVWIGVKLLLPEGDGGHGEVKGSTELWGAVKTVIVADFVMSLDNVIAIAGAAETAAPGQQLSLVIFGLLVSIPIIVWGSQIVLKLMDRYPMVITAGAMLLGWIAGTMSWTDPLVRDALPNGDVWRWGAGVAGALLVLAAARWLAARKSAPVAPGDA